MAHTFVAHPAVQARGCPGAAPGMRRCSPGAAPTGAGELLVFLTATGAAPEEAEESLADSDEQYDGSWVEWGGSDAPIRTGDAE